MPAAVVARFRLKVAGDAFVYAPWRFVQCPDERMMRLFLTVWDHDIEHATRVESLPAGVRPLIWEPS